MDELIWKGKMTNGCFHDGTGLLLGAISAIHPGGKSFTKTNKEKSMNPTLQFVKLLEQKKIWLVHYDNDY